MPYDTSCRGSTPAGGMRLWRNPIGLFFFLCWHKSLGGEIGVGIDGNHYHADDRKWKGFFIFCDCIEAVNVVLESVDEIQFLQDTPWIRRDVESMRQVLNNPRLQSLLTVRIFTRDCCGVSKQSPEIPLYSTCPRH